MINKTFPISMAKFLCTESYSENGVDLVKGKTYEVYSYDCNFVYIWGIKNAKFSHLFFWEHFAPTEEYLKEIENTTKEF